MGDISFKFLGVDFIFTNREIYCWIFLLPLLLLLSLLLLLLLLLGFDSKNETQLNQKRPRLIGLLLGNGLGVPGNGASFAYQGELSLD